MTSLIKADNIAKADGTSEVATEYVTQGSAKSFSRVNQNSTQSLRSNSLNVTSLTDTGLGQSTITMASALANSDGVVVHGFQNSVGNYDRSGSGSQISTTTYEATSLVGANSTADFADVRMVVFGDLA